MTIQKHDLAAKKRFQQRTFDISVGFIADQLKPGTSVIDCGCGPGNITVEIAKRVAPGRVVGFDADASSLAMARELAASQQVTNITFQPGNVYQLPFADKTFDVAYSHAVLSNLEEPVTALKEYARVVKPGGIVAVRESDYSTASLYPESDTLTKVFNLLGQYGNLYGDLFIGKKLRQHFRQANLTPPVAEASSESYGDNQNLKSFLQYLGHQLAEAQVQQSILNNGWASEAELQQYIAAINAIDDVDDLFFSYNWVSCFGIKV